MTALAPFDGESTHELDLDEQLCFALYAAGRRVTAAYQPFLAELGLTYPQYLVLLVLWERDNVPVKAIGDRLKLDSGTLSPLLKRMEAGGLLERRDDGQDERRRCIALTEFGRALRPRALAMRREMMCRSQMPPELYAQLRDLVRQLL